MTQTNKQFRLAARPVGMPKPTDWSVVTEPVKEPAEGEVAVKNRRHGALNPFAQTRTEVSIDEVMNSRMVFDPLTLLQCCPSAVDGAAASPALAGLSCVEYERSTLGLRRLQAALSFSVSLVAARLFQYFWTPGGGVVNPSDPSKRIGNEAVFGVRTNVTF